MKTLSAVAACAFAFASTALGATTMRDVDFKNLSYSWPAFWGGVPSSWEWLTAMPRSIGLVDGDYRSDKGFVAYAGLLSVSYGDLTGDGKEEAAVVLHCSPGGTGTWQLLYVYTLADGSLKLLGVLRSGSRAYGGLLDVQIAGGALILDFQDPDRAVADCCSRGVIRVRYHERGGRFVEVAKREKDTQRVWSYALRSKDGPQSVKQQSGEDRQARDIIYTDSDGVERAVALSGGAVAEPDLSADRLSVVFVRELGNKQRGIWIAQTNGSGERKLRDAAVRWNGALCAASRFHSPQWSIDGRSVFFVAECTATTGALWRLDIASQVVTPLIADAAAYRVIHAGQYRGYLIANQRSLPTKATAPRYPAYPFFLFTPEGKLVQQVGEEGDDIENLQAAWEGR